MKNSFTTVLFLFLVLGCTELQETTYTEADVNEALRCTQPSKTACPGADVYPNAWAVLCEAGVDKDLRCDVGTLEKVDRYLSNHPEAEDAFVDALKKTSDPERFIDRTLWVDELKRQYDPEGNSAHFVTQGLEVSHIPQPIYEAMVAEASAPEFLDGVISSGSSVPESIAVSEGYTVYKVVSQSNPSPSPYTPYWAELDALTTYGATADFEQNMGLPVASHGATYTVYKIAVKPGADVNVFKSTIARTTEAGYQTTGGATQLLVLDRSKWTDPAVVSSVMIFPPYELSRK